MRVRLEDVMVLVSRYEGTGDEPIPDIVLISGDTEDVGLMLWLDEGEDVEEERGEGDRAE